MKRIDRLRRTYAAEWNAGARIADNFHYGIRTRELIKMLRSHIAAKQRNSRTQCDARHALYRGAMTAHAAERALMRRYHF